MSEPHDPRPLPGQTDGARLSNLVWMISLLQSDKLSVALKMFCAHATAHGMPVGCVSGAVWQARLPSDPSPPTPTLVRVVGAHSCQRRC